MRKILVPLDGSAESESILPAAERLVPPDGELHLLHVVPVPMPPTGMAIAPLLILPEMAQGYLQQVRSGLPRHRGLDLVRSGEPADRILQAALELNIDAIAMSTHAHRGLTRWVLGSVAESVVRDSRLPVLVQRPGTAPRAGPPGRILVPLDEFEASQAVLAQIKPLAAQWKAEIVLLHVRQGAHDPAPQWAGKGSHPVAGGTGPHYQELADRLEEEQLVAWSIVSEGETAGEILRQAKELDVDLIAMSTHGRKGLDRMLMGSVTQEVLRRSERPLLLLRPAKGAAHD